MVDVEYTLNRKGYGFSHVSGIVRFGITNLDFSKTLNDEEINTYISDAITHEFLHEVLEVEFDRTTCKLFDMIGHHLRENNTILEKTFNRDDEYRTWDVAVKEDGVQYVLDVYRIDSTAMNQAFIVCNSR